MFRKTREKETERVSGFMGRATRWLKALFAFKKHNNTETTTEAAWLRSYYIEAEKEQSKHAVEVAAATAAVADAALVAARAAVAVVKLISNGRATKSALLENCRERYAAVRIQSVFRGYLARKALRALRSLVKLQAVVRGFLVRKQAAATLRSMQALVNVMSRRVSNSGSRFSDEFVSLKAKDNLETRSVDSRRFSSTFEAKVDERAKIVEMDTSGRPRSRSRSRRMMPDQSHYYSTRLSPYAYDSEWELGGDECKFSTAQSTPRFSAKRASEWTLNPSYMAKTQSFRAKLRSHSAPKQRSSDGVMKRRVSLLEMMEARNSLSGVMMQPSVSFKNVGMRKLDGSLGEGRNGYYNNAIRR